MSMTTSIGVVGPSYWSYMAATMAQHLQTVLDTKRIPKNNVPIGVYNDVKTFFHLVNEAADGSRSENPPASMNAYVIASEAVVNSIREFALDENSLKGKLKLFSNFVDQLADGSRRLKSNELQLVSELKQFFVELHQFGESEAHEKDIHHEMPSFALIQTVR